MIEYNTAVVKLVFFFQCHHMSLMDFVVSPPGCGRSVTDFWGWDTHEAQLRCPDEVDGDMWSTRRGLNLSPTKLSRPWSPWESSPSSKYSHNRAGNRTRDLMISSQKLWPLDHVGKCGSIWLGLCGVLVCCIQTSTPNRPNQGLNYICCHIYRRLYFNITIIVLYFIMLIIHNFIWHNL
jgi:hypothetical protein